MRTALVAASALAVALAGQAAAADLPVAPAYRAAPIVVPYNWNGYYIGANVGWSRAQSNVSFAANPAGFPADAASINTASQNRLTSNSVTGGAQTGYNWQWSNLVAGVEADVSFLNNNAQLPAVPLPAPSAPGTSLSETAQLSWLVTARPRLGYAWDNWLVYVTGGWAIGKVTFTDGVVPTAGAPVGTSTSRTKNGWTVGGGVEYGLIGGWSAKLEYLYTNLGSVNVVFGPVAVPGAIAANHDLTDQIVRVGVNYRFGANNEVVVKYP
ncbi:MAG: outer membrane beta-barrel protein [Xanthobacteraceae bacterium]|jgi:outer membrane immunogenic protein